MEQENDAITLKNMIDGLIQKRYTQISMEIDLARFNQDVESTMKKATELKDELGSLLIVINSKESIVSEKASELEKLKRTNEEQIAEIVKLVEHHNTICFDTGRVGDIITLPTVLFSSEEAVKTIGIKKQTIHDGNADLFIWNFGK